jgi:predicted  nucleic acid-binding Zn-ribbon protein
MTAVSHFEVNMIDPVRQSINEVVKERDELRAKLEAAQLQIETLRDEALAWRAKSDAYENTVTVTLSLDTLRQLWAAAKPNVYANQED